MLTQKEFNSYTAWSLPDGHQKLLKTDSGPFAKKLDVGHVLFADSEIPRCTEKPYRNPI